MLTADTIAGFSGSLLQKSFDGAVKSPACHMEWWKLCCNPNAPLVAIAAPRNHAKSTAITFTYTMACMLFRERQYALIVSDTVAQAILFLNEIKKELADNERIRALFGIKEFTKDAEDDMIVKCNDGYEFRIQAKGAEQKVRGLKWNKKRPDLIVCDDLENDEIVLNKERREKFRKWFNNALLPCRSIGGIVRYVGTVLHADSLLERLMPKMYDKKTTIQEELKTYSLQKNNDGWWSFKYKAHNEDFSELLWPERYTKDYFVELRQNFISQGIPDGYSQEYLNIPIDESLSLFKRADFLDMDKDDKSLSLKKYITIDLAIAEHERADYSVFLVAGVDENRKIHIIDVIRDRLDGKEIVDMILMLERVHKPEAIGIEEMQVSKAIGPFLREEMIKTNTFPTIVNLKHGGKDKIQRCRSIQARMRAHTVKFAKANDWYLQFEDEICSFPRGKHDDQVDAFSYLGMMLDFLIEAPTVEEQEEEIYQDELRASELWDTGRSSVTGY